MKLIKILFLCLAFCCSINLKASSYSDFYKQFSDSTLRLDYVFGGNTKGSQIFLVSQSKQNGWAGRHKRLNEVPLRGNGNIIVKNPEKGDTLYINSFSTLFQEWLNMPELLSVPQSFENSFLVPLPLREADITVTLRDNKGDEIASLTHRYRPEDELVKRISHNPLPYKYIHKGNSPEKAIDLAILAEGYTADEMESFIETAKQIGEEILSYEPFSSNKDKFNIVAVLTPSEESGVSIPRKNEWINSRYDSHFSTFYSDRYLTSPRVFKMHQDLEGIPYEYILMVVNTDEYGGGGIFNSYQIASANNKFTLPVSVHEFGHSFGGLADEYNYQDTEDATYLENIEPWEPNITTLVDFNSKWKDMVSPDTQIPTPSEYNPHEENKSIDVESIKLGAYEGAGYKKTGIYRPSVTCRMRDNYFPIFCKVCQKSLSETIDFYTH